MGLDMAVGILADVDDEDADMVRADFTVIRVPATHPRGKALAQNRGGDRLLLEIFGGVVQILGRAASS
jgi:hypothetical protein